MAKQQQQQQQQQRRRRQQTQQQQQQLMSHIDLLLGNDPETNEKTAVARQRSARNNGSTVGSNVFNVVLSEAISLDR
jgi:hypothetical protein